MAGPTEASDTQGIEGKGDKVNIAEKIDKLRKEKGIMITKIDGAIHVVASGIK